MKALEVNTNEKEGRFILVGNIIVKHFYGENKEIKSGTKHFCAGAKVYLIPLYGGMGHEKIPVIGLPRKKWKKIEVTIDSKLIKNVRVKKTYDIKLIEKIKDTFFYLNMYELDNEFDKLNEFAKLINDSNKEIKISE